MKYAEKTEVSAEKSRAEIENVLRKYGASGFAYGWEETTAMLQFRIQNRQVRFVLAMPDPKDRQFWRTPGRGLARNKEQAHQAWEQATRQRWRALALVVKAKLEAVEAGIATFEQEFLAHIVLPDGRSIGEYVIPQIETAYHQGGMPKLLPGVGGAGMGANQ